MDVYDRLDDLSADTAEARAANILHGLGFTKEMQQKATKDFSGGNSHLHFNNCHPFSKNLLFKQQLAFACGSVRVYIAYT